MSLKQNKPLIVPAQSTTSAAKPAEKFVSSSLYVPKPRTLPQPKKLDKATDIVTSVVMDHCERPMADYRQLGRYEETKHGQLVHIDRGSKILAVAHLDTVMYQKSVKDGSLVISPQLDDRLGAAIVVDLLPRLGIITDVLLTDNEETGNTTGQHFTADKEYNWIFSFDRAGLDAVMYQYEDDKDWYTAVEQHATVGMGSFSCISSMDHLGVCAVNWGCGYYYQHSPDCHACAYDVIECLTSFKKFYTMYYTTRFPYEPRPHVDRWDGYYRHYRQQSHLDWECRDCGGELEQRWDYCPWCGFAVN